MLRKRVDKQTKRIQSSLEEKDALLQEKEVLLQEIHHRVKNNLSIISGLIGMQLDTTDDKEAQRVLEDSQSRIQSMAMIHDKLYQTDSLSDIRLDNYLEELVTAIDGTFKGVNDSVTLKFDLEPAEVNIDKIVPCGLLVNELVVNAYKHAFVPGASGVLEVSLENENGNIELIIADNGPGLPGDFANAGEHSLGSMLITTFATQLEAEMELPDDREGAAFRFTFSAN